MFYRTFQLIVQFRICQRLTINHWLTVKGKMTLYLFTMVNRCFSSNKGWEGWKSILSYVISCAAAIKIIDNLNRDAIMPSFSMVNRWLIVTNSAGTLWKYRFPLKCTSGTKNKHVVTALLREFRSKRRLSFNKKQVPIRYFFKNLTSHSDHVTYFYPLFDL